MKIVTTIALVAFTLPMVSHAEKLIYPDAPLKSLSKNESLLQKVSTELGLGLSAGNYQLTETKQSLLGQHFYFQQMFNGRAVDGAQVVITQNESGEVTKVYNNGVEQSLSKANAMPLISEAQAMENAWKFLKVNGELMGAPTVQLVYSKSFQLLYKISVSTTSPAGHFNLTVDAQSGSVTDMTDAALPRMKRQQSTLRLKSAPKFGSFAEAMSSHQVKVAAKKATVSEINRVGGTAQVFDPNPVVTLGRTDLTDASPGNMFTQAYRIEDLKDITFANGVYTLKGPKITLTDFEEPTLAPSTSADGSWIYERTNPKFNDAMTYVHIERSLRYVESLGYVNTRNLFPKSIEVDSNGLNGDDNSHYIPYSDQLAFGNGCIDDNEDTDVILHELGHAIQHHINPNWNGGDTGAMGEGFGDYWAATSSTTTEHGMQGNINWVFKWDGHNDCWPGRKLNTFTPTYNAKNTYAAHAPVDGGIGDELWSTPIFQAFLELQASGVARADIDKIILESHFGLGSGVKMPDMAKSIVKTAKALFPAKDYDKVYLKQFQKMKILK